MSSCNQCGDELTPIVNTINDHGDEIHNLVCVKPGCPNFGLLQISQENMSKIIKEVDELEVGSAVVA